MTEIICEKKFEEDKEYIYRTFDYKTLKGKVTCLRDTESYISMKVGGLPISLYKRKPIGVDDEKSAGMILLENIKRGDNVELSYIQHTYDTTLTVSFFNKTQDVKVTSEFLTKMLKKREETLRRREKHANMLRSVINNDRLLIFARAIDRGYELIDVQSCGTYDMFSVARKILTNMHVPLNTINSRLETGLWPRWNQIGNSEYYLGVFSVNEKRRNCSCGKKAYALDGAQYTIVTEGSYKQYDCEFCFFDTSHIRVPERFFNRGDN